jgi:hypothetical protein
MEKILEKMQNKFGYSINEEVVNEYEINPDADIVIISPQQAFDIMWNAKNIFTVVFIKKNGQERVLNARRYVKKCLKGGKLKYKPSEKRLVPCYEMQPNETSVNWSDEECKNRYKMVNALTTKVINYQGKTYSVDPNLA